jgi:hypothetical protein
MATVTKAKRGRTSSTARNRTRTSPAYGQASPTHEQIAERAYQLWEERGRIHGRDMEDWLNAEAQLRDVPDRF